MRTSKSTPILGTFFLLVAIRQAKNIDSNRIKAEEQHSGFLRNSLSQIKLHSSKRVAIKMT